MTPRLWLLLQFPHKRYQSSSKRRADLWSEAKNEQNETDPAMPESSKPVEGVAQWGPRGAGGQRKVIGQGIQVANNLLEKSQLEPHPIEVGSVFWGPF